MPKFENHMINGRYTDMTLQCAGEEFHVHRVIVCSQSPVFAAAVDGKFIEAQTCVIDLPEEDLETLKRGLAFLYNEDYEGAECVDIPRPSDPSTLPSDDHDIGDLPESCRLDIISHIDVFAFGDRYNIPKLKDLATSKFWTDMGKGNPWAEEGFSSLVQRVYQSTPASETSLRDMVARTCAANVHCLLENPGFIRVISEVDGVGLDVLHAVLDTHDRDHSNHQHELGQLRDGWSKFDREKRTVLIERDDLEREVEYLKKRLDTFKKFQSKQCRSCQMELNEQLLNDWGMED